MEYLDLRAVLNSPAYCHREPTLHQSHNCKEQHGSSKFTIRYDKNNKPCMVWETKELNGSYLHFPQDVLKLCSNTFLPQNHPTANKQSIISGFTKLNHQLEVGGECYKFCSHPSYRSKSRQNCGLWYNWANFVYLVGGDKEGENPPQEEFKAARKIQTAWRGLICYIDYQEHLTVRRIQSVWRSYVCRRNYRREKAAILIQSTWRGFLFDADYMFELSDIVVVQKQIRGWLAKRVVNKKRVQFRNAAATNIQKNWRRMVEETRFLTFKRNNHASTIIQTYWRRFWCFSNFIIALDCSIQIQAQVRGYLKRKKYLSRRLAAITIETAWRRAHAKKAASHLSTIREIAYDGKEIAKEQSRAAVLIQSHVRAKQARVAVRLFVAVCKIQAVWRGFFPRRSYVTYVAARDIQAAWRRYFPRQGFVNFIAARRIQNSWRCRKANQNVSQLRKEFNAASLIQSVWRGFVCYTDFVFTLSDVIAAQRIVRGYLSRKKYSGTIRSNIEETKSRMNAGVAIQRIYRGFQARQNYWYTLGCTMQIQSWWRGRRVYRRIRVKKNAILTLQCFLRCSLARQEYMQRRFVFMLIQTAELERSKKVQVINVQQKIQKDVEEHKLDAATFMNQHSSTHANHHHVDDIVVATEEQCKNFREETKKEKRSDDMEETLLEDIWIRLVAKSDIDEEPFVRHYNLGAGRGDQPQKHSIFVQNDTVRSINPSDDATDCSQLKLSTMTFPPHPNSSIRMIRKVDAIDMDDDFQLEEAFIDAEISHAKERRFYAGSNHGKKKVNTRSGFSRSKSSQGIMKDKNER